MGGVCSTNMREEPVMKILFVQPEERKQFKNIMGGKGKAIQLQA